MVSQQNSAQAVHVGDEMDPVQPSATVGMLIRERRLLRRLTLQRLAEVVGCARSYLWLIEHERRDNPPSDELLIKLEEALGFEPGRLIQAARWQETPAVVRHELSRLQSRQRVAYRLVEILTSSGVDADGRIRGAIDEAYRTGELKRLIDRIAPERKGTPPGEMRTPAAGGESVPLAVGLPLEVPLINSVAAGYPRAFTDLGYPARVADEYVRCPDLDDPDAFAARVVGDSMLPDYREGDIVVFSPARPVVSGTDCFARIEPDHESTFKRAYFEKGPDGEDLIRLQPLNPAYPPRVFPREQVAGLYAAVSVTRRVG